jgi:hypothetical protein
MKNSNNNVIPNHVYKDIIIKTDCIFSFTRLKKYHVAYEEIQQQKNYAFIC